MSPAALRAGGSQSLPQEPPFCEAHRRGGPPERRERDRSDPELTLRGASGLVHLRLQSWFLADAQLRTDCMALCEELRRTYHPLHARIMAPLPGLSYYWTAPQTEFSSDVLFRDQARLDRLVPRLILHAMLNLCCEQVMRFLGKQLNSQFGGEVVSDLRRGPDGVRRLKHWVHQNSLKRPGQALLR
jgi:hypothetical protein